MSTDTKQTTVNQYGDIVAIESTDLSTGFTSILVNHGYHRASGAAARGGEEVATWTRGDFIALLKWNDRNGTFTDEDSAAEGLPPLTREAAAELAKEVFGRD